MKFLIVDDNARGADALERFLLGAGHHVESVRDAGAALSKLRSNSFDAVVSEVLLPGTDGFRFCRAFKSDRSIADIPFVFYTSTFTTPEDAALGRRLGAADYLARTDDHRVVLAAVEKWYREQRLVRDVSDAPEPALPAEDPSDADQRREYNVRLVKKLAHRVAELEAARRLTLAEAVLASPQGPSSTKLLPPEPTVSKDEAPAAPRPPLVNESNEVAIVARDVNNLLTAMLGFAELALTSMQPEQAGREEIVRLVQVAERAKDLTRRFLVDEARRVASSRASSVPPPAEAWSPASPESVVGASASSESPAGAPGRETEGPPTGLGERVLVVDADEATRRVATRMLARLGYRPSDSSTPREALARLRAEPVDLLVIGVGEGSFDARSFLRSAREIRGDLPTIWLAAGRVGLEQAAGADAVVRKPFTLRFLSESVAAVLASRREAKQQSAP